MNRGLHRGQGMRGGGGGGKGGRGGHVSDFFVTQGSSLLSPSVIGSSFSHARERWPPLNSTVAIETTGVPSLNLNLPEPG